MHGESVECLAHIIVVFVLEQAHTPAAFKLNFCSQC